MKPGKGQQSKGASFERLTGKELSMWLTQGEKPDLFSRNVLSGGSFTNAEKSGVESARSPGDLIAAHPLAFSFTNRFLVECKHHADLGLQAYLFNSQSTFGKIISLAKRQAEAKKQEYMVVARENRMPVLLFVSGNTGDKLMGCLRSRNNGRVQLEPMYHRLHNNRVFCMRFEEMLTYVSPKFLLEE